MNVIGINITHTAITGAILDYQGSIINKEVLYLENREGKQVELLLQDMIESLLAYTGRKAGKIKSIGICIPGITNSKESHIWAPHIPGWLNYPLYTELQDFLQDRNIRVNIASDRSCLILGEKWKGQAINSENAIYVSVGIGIGIGVLIDGRVIHGVSDIAGSAGWMAVKEDHNGEYSQNGCLEYYASGEGIVNYVKKIIKSDCPLYRDTTLKDTPLDKISFHDICVAHMKQDPLAVYVLYKAIKYWGIAAANIVSLFNPDTVIWGGELFGYAQEFIQDIYSEACKWGQPISMQQVQFKKSLLSEEAALIGAGYLALTSLKR